MGTISTINERWRIFTLTCFMCCILLTICLNYGRGRDNNRSLSTFQSMAISLSSTSTPSNEVIKTIEIEKPAPAPAPANESESMMIKASNIETEKTAALEKKLVEECNIFNGKWVYNPKASPLYSEPRCPFLSEQVRCQRNGRPDNEYEKWTWEAQGCEIPR